MNYTQFQRNARCITSFCTWMARGLQMPAQASVALLRRPRGRAVLMFSALEARRTDWRWVKRSSFSIASWQLTSITDASRPASLRRRCDSLRRHGWDCLRVEHGCAMPRMQTSCAKHFAAQISGIPGIKLAAPVEANAVFLSASDEILNSLRARGWKFYTFIGGATRFMFSWDSDLSRVDVLCRDLKECAAQAQDKR